MKVVSMVSIKGGVGKSTIGINVLDQMESRGSSVGIDLDPQASMTDHFLPDLEPEMFERYSVRQVLLGEESISDCLHGRIVPATIELAEVTEKLGFQNFSGLRQFRDDVRSLSAEYVIIDSVGALTYEFMAAIYAADVVMVPIQYNRWAMKSLAMVINRVAMIPEEIRPEVVAVPSMATASMIEALQRDLKDLNNKICRLSSVGIKRERPIQTAIDRRVPLEHDCLSMFQELIDQEIVSHGKVRA